MPEIDVWAAVVAALSAFVLGGLGMVGRSPRPMECVAVYVRVSGPEQAKGWSLEGQYREVRAYCDARKYRVVRSYKDVGSGRTLRRSGFATMIDAAERGLFDAIVVWRRDRFGRSVVNNGVLERLLSEAGVRVEAVLTGRQKDTPDTRLVTRIMDALDEYEPEKIAERCAMGRREAARRGVWPMKPPFGYRRIHTTKGLRVDKEEALLVQRAFTLARMGMCTRGIGEDLGRNHATVQNWIHKDAYLGVLVYDGIRVEGAWPAIVTPEEAQEARKALKSRRTMVGA